MDRSLAGYERVLFYAEGLEKMSRNKEIPQLFRDIFKGAFLPFKDPAVLDLFLKGISEFKYENSEELGNAFEYLLSTAASQGDAGQFRTPRHIIDFIVEVVDPQKEDRILDPACGTAGFLVSAYKHILKNNTDKKSGRPGSALSATERKKLTKNIVGYDISHEMVRLSLVNLYLHGFAEPNIHEYDTLSSLERWDESFDCLLANPPFMTPKGGIQPHNRFPIQSKRAEVLFVDYITEHLSSNGKAGIIVPEGIIFQSGNSYKQLRKMLVEDGLWAVVSLPQGVFNPYAGVKTSILFYDNNITKKVKEILFVKIENDGFDLGAQRRPIDKNDLPKAIAVLQKYKKAIHEDKKFKLSKEEEVYANVVKKDKIAESDDYNLSAERYKNNIAITKSLSYAISCPKISLGEVCEIYQPKTITSKEIKDRGDYRVYGANGVIGYYDKYNHDNEEVLMTCRGATCGTINLSEPKSWITGNAMVLSPKNNLLDKHYLYYLLKSAGLKSVITGSAQPQITRSSLAPFKIPLPPIEVQREIVIELDGYQKIIDGAKQVIDNYKPTIKLDLKWKRAELGDVCEVEYGYGETAKENGDVRYIRITDIDENGKLRDEPKYTNLTEKSKHYLLNKGDIVVARTGATYGKTLLYDKEEKAIFASFLMRLNFDKKIIFPQFYWIFTQTPCYWEQAKSLVSGGAQPQFNGNVIKKIKIPIPPIEIQKKIVARIQNEQRIVGFNNEIIKLFEQKIKEKISELWGE